MKRQWYSIALLAALPVAVSACESVTSPERVQQSEPSDTGSLAPAAASLAQTRVFHDNSTVSADAILYSPCADEDILVTGVIHVAVHTVEDASGFFQSHGTMNDQNVSGVGVSSGTRYRRVGATNTTSTTRGRLPLSFTFTNTFTLIGKGRSPNMVVTETVHVTVNANGEQTATVSSLRLECR